MTTAAEASRIVTLAKAKAVLVNLRRVLGLKPGEGWDRRALVLCVSDFSGDNRDDDAEIELDIDTGKKLLLLIDELIEQELATLGFTE